MATKINLTIGDQRLVAASKTRSAANQQALEDRTSAGRQQSAASSAAASQSVPSRERPGASVTNRYQRRPTARRKQQKTEIYGVDGVKLADDTQSLQTFSAAWTAYGSRFFYGGPPDYSLTSYDIATKTRFNSYTLQDKYIQPLFFKELGKTRPSVGGYMHQIIKNVEQLNWTLRQRSRSASGVESVDAAPPQLPFLFEDKVYSASVRGPYFVTSDGSNIYVSAQVLYMTPAETSLRTIDNAKSIYDPTAYENDLGFLSTLHRAQKLQRDISSLGTTPNFTALYWKFNLAGSSASFYKKTTTNQLLSDSIFLNNLDPSDPQREVWLAYKSTFNGLSDSTIAESYLYGQNAPHKRWPPGLIYSKKTGQLSMATRTAGEYEFRVFAQTIESNKTYTEACSYLPPNYDRDNRSAASDADFASAGWTLERVISSPFNRPQFYFAVIK